MQQHSLEPALRCRRLPLTTRRLEVDDDGRRVPDGRVARVKEVEPPTAGRNGKAVDSLCDGQENFEMVDTLLDQSSVSDEVCHRQRVVQETGDSDVVLSERAELVEQLLFGLFEESKQRTHLGEEAGFLARQRAGERVGAETSKAGQVRDHAKIDLDESVGGAAFGLHVRRIGLGCARTPRRVSSRGR